MESLKSKNGKLYKLVFCKYIRKNGKIIYPKNAKVFAIWVPVNNVA
jgi:hypothetical protein|nr:MAG TPA: Protein of unknown function (DUF4257) [Caudoviricetes sp.]